LNSGLGRKIKIVLPFYLSMLGCLVLYDDLVVSLFFLPDGRFLDSVIFA
jgi:hypothetical protein